MSPALISFLLDDDTRSLCILGYSNPGGGGAASILYVNLGARAPLYFPIQNVGEGCIGGVIARSILSFGKRVH